MEIQAGVAFSLILNYLIAAGGSIIPGVIMSVSLILIFGCVDYYQKIYLAHKE